MANIQGFDCSHYQNSIDWQKVRDVGYSFVVCKASQGINRPDITFDAKITGAKTAGLIVGAYHFFDPAYSGIDQADFFLKRLKPDHFPMLIALDLEQYAGWDSLTLQQIQDEVMNKFLDTVQTATRCKPLIYTNPAFANQYLKEIPLGTYPLWLSAYRADIPLAWISTTAIWQRTGKGHIAGIDGEVDIDEFEGQDINSLLAQKMG